MKTAVLCIGVVLLALSWGCGRSTEPEPEGDHGQADQAGTQDGPLTAQAFQRDSSWLAAYDKAQRAAAKDAGLTVDFGFTDRQPDSGVDFVMRSVPDGNRAYKPVHYDHGNGVAVADVNGDGLVDLYFCNQAGSNALYLNTGKGKFADITKKAGVGLADRVSVAASFADVDNDGDPDLFVTTVRGGNALFENRGAGRFADITNNSGLGYSGHSSGAVFFDYDRDGHLDLYLTNVGVYTTNEKAPVTTDPANEATYFVGFRDAFSGHLKPERTEYSILYRNLGSGQIEDVTERVGLRQGGWNGDATPIDADGDGWQDLYVLNMQGHDSFFRNVEGKRFEDKSREVFPKTSWGAMGVKAFDWDNDADLDLFISDMHSDMGRAQIDEVTKTPSPAIERKKYTEGPFAESVLRSGGQSIFGNSFFQSDGQGGYEEVSDRIGAENLWPWGLSTGDLDADGFLDVFLASSMNGPFRYAVNNVLLNDSGKALRGAEFLLGIEPRRDGQTIKPWYDLDCAGADAGNRFCKRGPADGRFTVYDTLGSRSSALVDLDADGDLDIVTNDFDSAPMLLFSDLADKGQPNWLEIRLIGTRSNRAGLGARVIVEVAGRKLHQVHDGKSGYLAQSAVPLYFGLGGAKEATAVEVHWPSGTVQRLPKQATGTRLAITEPPPAVPPAADTKPATVALDGKPECADVPLWSACVPTSATAARSGSWPHS